QTVTAANGDRSQRAVLGQFADTLVMDICKQNSQNIISDHHFATSSASIIALGGTTVPGSSTQPAPRTATPHSSLFSTSSGRAPTLLFALTTQFSATMAY